MNFFEHQAKARRTSTRLVLLFALAVVAIVVAVDLAVMLVFGRRDGGVGILVFTTLVTPAVIAGASMFRIAPLRAGRSAERRAGHERFIESRTRREPHH